MEDLNSSQNQTQPKSRGEGQEKRPWYKKKRFVIPIGLFVLAGIGSGISDDSEPTAENATVQEEVDATQDSTNSEQSSNSQESDSDTSEDLDEKTENGAGTSGSGSTDSESTEEVEEEGSSSGSDQGPSVSASQANAIDSAESYLRFSSFSRSGLIDQLEFEGFSNSDAAFAVDYIAPDWFEQAVKSAESYLDFGSFSRQGLIDQLEFEGFTTEEATYGADQVGLGDASPGSGGGETVSQANAVESAESYLRFSSFSRTGLIEQLEVEGYSNSDATYAVDKLNPDWFEQAAKSAESYLDFGSFSRQGLIDQLRFEGFTAEEAIYGVNAVGL